MRASKVFVIWCLFLGSLALLSKCAMYVVCNFLFAVRLCNWYTIINVEPSVKACKEAKQEKKPRGTRLYVWVGKNSYRLVLPPLASSGARIIAIISAAITSEVLRIVRRHSYMNNRQSIETVSQRVSILPWQMH